METATKEAEKLEDNAPVQGDTGEKPAKVKEEKTPKEKVEDFQIKEADRLKILRNEEKRLAREFRKRNVFPEEDQPPIMMDDEYGNTMAHILMDGKYVPKPIADVMMQEKKIVMEYQILEELKEIEETYKANGVKSLKINNKKND
jgi:hypothetical protein